MPNANLAAVARLTDALSRATTLEAVYDAALDTLQQSLGVDRASILLFDANDVMSFVAWRGISESYRAAVNGHTPWRPGSTDVEPITISDAYEDASLASYRAVFDAEGIRALAFFALVYRDKVIGKFMLYHAEPHAFGADEIDLAHTIASQIAFGVARVRAELELQRERDRMNDLVANVPGVVWETVGTPNVDQHVTFVSPQIEQLLGYTRAEWYGNPHFWTNVIVDQSDEEIGRKTLAGMAGADPTIHHYRMRTRDGRLIWTEVRSAYKVDETRAAVIRGVTMDVTAQKEAERRAAFLSEASAVLASSLDYETTLAHVAQLVVAGFAHWCAIDVRDDDGETRRLLVTHRDPAKRAAVERMHAIRPERQRTQVIMRAIESGEPVLMREIDLDAFRQHYANDPDIIEAHLDLGLASYIVVPLLAGGRSFGALSLVSSDRKRLFDPYDLELACELGRRAGYAIDNARLYKQAQEANRAKDEFLATLSHELRTPMTATLGWASMLRSQDVSADNFRLAIDTIERSTRAQAKLIDDILDVSRIVTGKLRLTIAPLNLRAIIEAAVDAIHPAIVAKAIDLNVRFESDPIQTTGDAARLQQVIWNVLANAVKFTPPGGSIDIDVTRPANDRVCIEVRDSGMGIPRRLLPHIFERFRQGDSSSTRVHGGLGLGLAIVKSLVELHGGHVTAASEGEGKGATFTIALPLTSITTSIVSHPAAEANAPLALSGVQVLLVEDEDDTRFMLSAALQSFGANVTAVRSAQAAYDALDQSTPHVVVSDIGMPGEDGYSFIMKIRSGRVARVRNVPAIALTAYARPEDRTRALDAGYGYHLAKPVDPLVIVKTVREAAGR